MIDQTVIINYCTLHRSENGPDARSALCKALCTSLLTCLIMRVYRKGIGNGVIIR